MKRIDRITKGWRRLGWSGFSLTDSPRFQAGPGFVSWGHSAHLLVLREACLTPWEGFSVHRGEKTEKLAFRERHADLTRTQGS